MSTAEILQAAMSLPPDERGEIAHQLLLSLDPEPTDEDANRAWADEVNRRRQAIREGRTTLLDWDDAVAGIRKTLASRGPS